MKATLSRQLLPIQVLGLTDFLLFCFANFIILNTPHFLIMEFIELLGLKL